MPVIIRHIGDGREIVCSTPISGGDLLKLLGQDVVILANLQPLTGGKIHRTFRRVTRDAAFHLLGLDAYAEV